MRSHTMQYQTLTMRLVIGVLTLAGLAACGNPPQTPAPREPAGAADLVSVLASTTTPDDSRKAADKQLVALKGKTDETRLSILEQIIFAPGHSDAMRQFAMDQLADADAARAGK